MAEPIKPELLNFLTPSGEPLNVLVVESVGYLPELRRMLPSANIWAVAAEADESSAKETRALNIRWEYLDYRETPLPFRQEYFDYIISDLTLEQVINPQDTAAGFGLYLKQTGVFITSFRNIRHWSVLKMLMEGHFYALVSRYYTRSEFSSLLYASFYKDVRMKSQKRPCLDDLVERLERVGFDNFGEDLETEFYLVWAAKSMPELALLKSLFTAEIRKNLSRLLHRIEYDVEPEKSVAAFWNLYEEAGLFADYAANFIKETIFHPEKFYETLERHTPKSKSAKLAALRRAAKK